MANVVVHEDVIEDLQKVQKYESMSLVQMERLGQEYAFLEAVEPADKLIRLFKKLPEKSIDDFPVSQKQQIQNASKSVLKLFQEIKDFDAKSNDALATHSKLVQRVRDTFVSTFTTLHTLIAFSVSQEIDFSRLTEEGTTAVNSIKDSEAHLLDEINFNALQTNEVLEQIRSAAAEVGVTQQAIYFETESKLHLTASSKWGFAVFITGVVLLGFAVTTLFFPNFWFKDSLSIVEMIQIVVSKILVFGILAFAVSFCVKNFLAHRHNIVVNRHRQNALMTYSTLAEAGNTSEARDAVLQHAAAAIYSPASSGYLKSEDRGRAGNPSVGFSPRFPISGQQISDG